MSLIISVLFSISLYCTQFPIFAVYYYVENQDSASEYFKNLAENASQITSIASTIAVLLGVICIINTLITSRTSIASDEKLKIANRKMLVIKVMTVPFFAINYVIYAVFSIFGGLGAIFLIAPLGMLVALFVLIVTSTYSILTILNAYKLGYLSKNMKICLIISQLIFCIDIIGTAIIHTKVNNALNKKENTW